MATDKDKRWAKEARLRRQALKKAAMPPTNLFQARIRRTELSNRPRSNGWVWVLFFLIVGAVAAAWVAQHSASVQNKLNPATVSAPGSDLSTALQTSSSSVATPVAVSVAPLVTSSVVASTGGTHVVLPDTHEWHGPTSNIQTVREVVIKSRRAWRALWLEMGRTDEVPRVNFFDHEVVGLFAGPKAGAGYEIQLEPGEESGTQVSVPYRVIEPLPGTPLSTEKTFPWQLRVIEHTDKPVHFMLVSQANSTVSH